MEAECCICLEALNEFALAQTVGCTHTFHAQCLCGLTSFNCPLCRADIHPSLTKRQRKLIYSNIRKRKKEIEADEMSEFQREYERDERFRRLVTVLCLLIAIAQPREYTLIIDKIRNDNF